LLGSAGDAAPPRKRRPAEDAALIQLSESQLRTIRAAPLFSAVPDDAMLRKLLAAARVVEYPRGRLLFTRSQPAEHFFLIFSGGVKIFLDTVDGEQTVLEVAGRGETFAEAVVFLGLAYPASAEVAEDAQLLEIPAQPFLRALEEDNRLALAMLAALSRRLHQLINRVAEVSNRKTDERLADFILTLVDQPAGAAEVRLPFEKALVAKRLGMTPESLSRALAKLRAYGISTDGTLVRLADIGRLRAAYGADP
jgi:CRP/FNR family transcriptional regulator, dissimilatory nitrate respiration regulator